MIQSPEHLCLRQSLQVFFQSLDLLFCHLGLGEFHAHAEFHAQGHLELGILGEAGRILLNEGNGFRAFQNFFQGAVIRDCHFVSSCFSVFMIDLEFAYRFIRLACGVHNIPALNAVTDRNHRADICVGLTV